MFFLVKNLDFIIANNTILSELNFSLDNGSHLIISGPSGSGKSTLINLMSGLYRPTSGHVSFESNDYSKLTDKDIDEMRAKNFGLIFQRLHLIKHLTVEQNILLAQCGNLSKNMAKILNMLVGSLSLKSWIHP